MDSKEDRRKEIIKIETDINEIENKSETERTNKAKSCLFEKILKSFGELDQEEKEKIQITNIRNKMGTLPSILQI